MNKQEIIDKVRAFIGMLDNEIEALDEKRCDTDHLLSERHEALIQLTAVRRIKESQEYFFLKKAFEDDKKERIKKAVKEVKAKKEAQELDDGWIRHDGGE